MSGRTVTIVASTVQPGTCRYCRAHILWATRASQPGAPAKTLPFNRPRPWPLSTTRNDETGLTFEVWPAEALHFVSCPHQPPRRVSPGARRRTTRSVEVNRGA